MKLFNAFALAAVAFASNLGGVASYSINIQAEIKVEGLSGTDVGTVSQDLKELPQIIEEKIGEGASRRELEGRRLPTVVEFQYCPSDSDLDFLCMFVTFGLGSVTVVETEVECTPELHAKGIAEGKKPPFTCTIFAISYFATVTIEGDPDDGLVVKFVEELNSLDSYIKKYLEGEIKLQYEKNMLQTKSFEFGVVGDIKVEGDPHFKTWSGTWFDFMGECDMKMIHAPHFDGEGNALDVDIRTKIRNDYSYVESAALKLGNDILEVSSFGDYFLNGVAGARMPAFVGGYRVTYYNPSQKVHIFEVAIGDKEKIVLKTFKDLVSVTVNEVDFKRFTGALGMSGSFDKSGKMVGRDGQTEITDPTDFANEWQIRSDEPMLFHAATGPQHPEQCKLPIVTTSEKRRRLGEGLAREKAERACAHFSGEQFENCVFDVMAVGDIEIAQAGVY